MGNTELRLTLAGIQEEIADVKSIALDVRAQATKTNGRVRWLEKMIYTALGALPLLTVWAGGLTYAYMHPVIQPTQEALQAAVNNAFNNSLDIKK